MVNVHKGPAKQNMRHKRKVLRGLEGLLEMLGVKRCVIADTSYDRYHTVITVTLVKCNVSKEK